MKEEKYNKSISYKIGQNIARIRIENNLTQEDMEEYGISRAYYGKIELGKHSLTLKKANAIANAFGIPISFLFVDKKGIPIK